MKLEISNREGKVVMWTEQTACIPATELLRWMAKAGYTFRLDGKAVVSKRLEILQIDENETASSAYEVCGNERYDLF